MKKRILSLLLVLTMLFCSVPMTAFAKENMPNDSSEVSYNENGLGGIINNLVEEKSNENPDCQISFIEIKDKTATVNLNNKDACQLVVAIYDEDTMQMLGSGVEQLEANSQTTSVEINIDTMPEHFVCFGYLLDENYSSVCDKYECQRYSSAFDEYLAKEPEDFQNDEILMFDDTKEQEDFAVLRDEVITADSVEMTYTYDKATKIYTFSNVTEEVKNLSIGDIFNYRYGEGTNEFLIIKVKSISVKGTTVEIEEDELSLSDVFKYVRVDAESDFSDVEIDESQLPDYLSKGTVSAESMPSDNKIKEGGSKTFSDTFKIEYEQKSESGTSSFKVSGSLGIKITAKANFIYDVELFGKDYYEFSNEVKITGSLNASVTGKITLLNKARLPIPAIPVGPFDIDINIRPIIEFSIAGTFNVEYTTKILTTADSTNGIQKTSESSTDWGMNIEGNITVKLGFSVEISFTFNIPPHAAKEVRTVDGMVSLGVTGSFYAKWESKADNSSSLHTCKLCLSGAVKGCFDLTFNLTIKLTDNWKISFDAIKFSREDIIADNLYFSISQSNKVSVGKGICPNKYACMTFVVKDKDSGSAIKNAAVSCLNAICDSNGDGIYNEHTAKTNSSGIAKLYFKKGNYSVTVSKTDYPDKNVDISVLSVEKTFNVKLSKNTTVEPSYYSNLVANKNVGDLITFGTYPQSKVTDSAILSKLSNIEKHWISYGYYSGTGNTSDGQMVPGDYMKYCDISYKGEKYRAVRFSQYRPDCTGGLNPASSTVQSNNGYRTGTIYYFKFEPLYWRVLDPEEGYIMCEHIIDSQAFNNYCKYTDGEYYGDPSCTYYASDWSHSSLRNWLNDDFYNLAFNSDEKNQIKKSFLVTDSLVNEKYDSESCYDKIFIISSHDSSSSYYGFDPGSKRAAKGTDYAKCQGLYVYSGNSYWRLRSPLNSSGTWYVNFDGTVYYEETFDSFIGIRPALKFNPESTIQTASISSEDSKREAVSDNNLAVTGDATKTIREIGCIAGEKYTVLNVSDYNAKDFALSKDNLQYINIFTADSNGKVEEQIKVKNDSQFSVTILSGNFADGSKIKMFCDNPCIIGKHTFNTEYINPTCEKNGYTKYTCELCGYYYENVYENTNSNDYCSPSSWITVLPATCTAEGLQEKHCIWCDRVLETEIIPRSSHKSEKYAEYIQYGIIFSKYHCSVCGEELPESSYNISPIGSLLEQGVLTNTIVDKSKNNTATIDFMAIGASLTPSINSILCDGISGVVLPFQSTNSSISGSAIWDVSNWETGAHIVTMTMQTTSVSSVIYVTCSHQNHVITKSDNGEYVHDCQFCGQRWIEPLCDHTNCQWKVTTPCTESENGLISKCCKDCNYIIENKELPAGSHFDVKSNENLEISDMLIKGFEQGIIDILEHFDFSGFDVTVAETENGLGTGSQINLSLENETIFTYYIVIDGDITGDGYCDAFDVSLLSSVANYETEFEENSAYFFAGDVTEDGFIDVFDLSQLTAKANYEI